MSVIEELKASFEILMGSREENINSALINDLIDLTPTKISRFIRNEDGNVINAFTPANTIKFILEQNKKYKK